MNTIKKVFSIGTISSTLLMCGTAFAASGTYTSTYSMKGGVESKRFDVGKKPTFVVSVTPTQGVWLYPEHKKEASIELILKKDVFGIDPEYDTSNVSSVTGGKRTLTNETDGKYYIYYRNYTDERMEGKTNISWKF
ncbi:hypothetical protein [Bacillus sp. AFS017336]|uniref:hypothetical protein n=1 Tax=Bacillus sp. AFS017336 TaxID=2033489 RepID=UPI000BF0F0DE|nr:hypothetical protein [Bacillus sp. AFS017336]PEL13498.1 hypothetical protein CN601_04965 [Bacillus sp. AFS017336]